MADHSITLAPVATGFFQSPDQKVKGRTVDVGLLAEALVYYDSIYVHVDNHEQFADLISLLIQHGLTYDQLCQFVEDGILRFFVTVWMAPVMGFGRHDMVSGLYGLREEAMNDRNYFANKFLESEGLRSSFTEFGDFKKSYFDRFCNSVEKTTVSFTNDEICDGVIENAYEDFLNPKRNKLIVRNLLKAVYEANGLGKPPFVRVSIKEVLSDNLDRVARNPGSFVIGRNLDNGLYKIYEVAYNNDLMSNIKRLEYTKTPLVKSLASLPLSESGRTNLILRSAERLGCDLFMPDPASKLVGDKLFEIDHRNSGRRVQKISSVVDSLQTEENFPDIRHLVNQGLLEFDKVLEIRGKAKVFRQWLQSETERDRDAIVAYHNEVSKQTGTTKLAKKALSLFGVLTSVGASIAAEAFFQDHGTVVKETAKKLAGSAIDSSANALSSRLFRDWSPLCFGNWLKSDIEGLLEVGGQE